MSFYKTKFKFLRLCNMKLLLTALAAIFAGAFAACDCEEHPSKPNIIVILTDDQDLHLDSMNYMPGVKKYLTDEGTYFNHHFATISLCCPSRLQMDSTRSEIRASKAYTFSS